MFDLAARRKKYPLGPTETALEPLEPAWVDFSWGVRSGRRVIRSSSRSGLRGRGLATVHRVLELHRENLAAGNRIAIYSALMLCAEENVPLPYWLADELLAINGIVHNAPASLHDLLGLGKALPAEGMKSSTARRDVQLQHQLWSNTSELIARAKREGRTVSIDKALAATMKSMNFPHAKTKARQMFDAQEAIQNSHHDAAKGIKRHRIVK